MSEKDQALLIENMAKLEEKGQTYLLGVMAGLVAAQQQKEQQEQEPVCEACRVKWPGEE